jgi:hypothetical protein
MSDIVNVDLALTSFVARQTSTRNPSPMMPSASSSQTLFGYAPWKKLLELCPRGNNKDVIIIILVHDNVYIPC